MSKKKKKPKTAILEFNKVKHLLYCGLLRTFNMLMNILNLQEEVIVGSNAQRYFTTLPQGNSWIKHSLKHILKIEVSVIPRQVS